MDVDGFGPDWVKTTKKRNRKSNNEHEMIKYELKLLIGSAAVIIRYYPNDYSDNPLLVIEISSIPRIINDSNAEPLKNDQQAFDLINEILRSIDGFPTYLDILQCCILRIDVFHNSNVGQNLQDYLHVISQLNYPYREKAVYTNQNSRTICNGILFYTKRGPVLKFYDKGVETGDEKFLGLLRQESCVRGSASIERSFGSSSIKLFQITEEMQQAVLLNDLITLGLNNPIIGDQDFVYEILKTKFGIASALRLKATIENLCLHQEFNMWEICSELGIKKSTLYKRMKQIKEAGLVPALYPRERILRPLSEYL
jgi:hypothetical protein